MLELCKSEEWLCVIFDNVLMLMMFIWCSDGVLIYVNEFLVCIVNCLLSEIVGWFVCGFYCNL